MDAWLRDTHRSTARVMRAAGADVARPGRGGDCCGALHVHAGRDDEARALARRVIASMPGDAPIVVNSAGCGAAMKDYGRLLGTPEARRVRGARAWTSPSGSPSSGRSRRRAPRDRAVVVQDPCHLRHVQKAHGAVRTVLGAGVRPRETDDDGLCCGAGGAYAALQPELVGERSATARSPRCAGPAPIDGRSRRVGQPGLHDAPPRRPASTSAIPPTCSRRLSMTDA